MSLTTIQRTGEPEPGQEQRRRAFSYRDALWQLVVAAGGYIVYSLSVGAVQWAGAERSRAALAVADARHVVDLEKLLGIFREHQLQSLIIDSGFWMQFFNAVYMWAHLPLIIALAVWLYWRHREHFRLTRNAVLISGTIALVVFQVFPVAPPRLVPELHFVDTAAKVSGVYDTVEPKVFFNPYAAVPSMHVGWVLLMGLNVFLYAGFRPLRWLGLALPVFMALAVVVTGNHYFLDAATGVLVALLGLWLAAFAEKRMYPRFESGRMLGAPAQGGENDVFADPGAARRLDAGRNDPAARQ
jgi:membrane-associated phospholipid phosphatase